MSVLIVDRVFICLIDWFAWYNLLVLQVYKSSSYNLNFLYNNCQEMALKQDGVQFVLCPKQSNIIEGFVLNRACSLGFFCPKQAQGFKPSVAQLYPNIGRVLLPHPFPSSVSGRLLLMQLLTQRSAQIKNGALSNLLFRVRYEIWFELCLRSSCPLDPLPTSLVVSCLDILLPAITGIINSH